MPTIAPYLLYEDVEGALDFLSRPFGFEEMLRSTGGEGYVSHAEMRRGDGIVYLGDPGDSYRSPRSLGAVTVGISVERRRRALRAREDRGRRDHRGTRGPALRGSPLRREGPRGAHWWFSQRIRELAEDWGATPAS